MTASKESRFGLVPGRASECGTEEVLAAGKSTDAFLGSEGIEAGTKAGIESNQ